MVMTMIVIGFALASVGSVAAISSIRNAGRDNDDKSAFGVAEAGAEQALYRQNKILTTPLTSSARCLTLSSSNTLIASYVGADGWCQEQTGTVNGGTYNYRVRPDVLLANGQRQVEIVSQGTLNGETRRVHVTAAASTGTPAFGGGQFVGLNRLDFIGDVDVSGSMKTNANINVQGSASCNGNATVGMGKTIVPNNSVCGGSVTQATTTLGPVDMGNIRTVNDNARLSNGLDVKTQANQVNWNATTKVLDLGAQSTLTVGGTNYLLCRLVMTGGSKLIVAQGAKVRFYFDTPENCGLPSGTSQVDLGGTTRVSVTSGNPADLAFLVAGSDTRTTNVVMCGNSQAVNDITIYAPKSIVTLCGNATYRGAVAGKELVASGNPTLIGVDSTLSFTTAVELAYAKTRFVECVGAVPASGSPSTGC